MMMSHNDKKILKYNAELYRRFDEIIRMVNDTDITAADLVTLSWRKQNLMIGLKEMKKEIHNERKNIA